MTGRQQGPAGEPESTIAVVIPAYRASATLGRALASVRSQSLLPNRILENASSALLTKLSSNTTGVYLTGKYLSLLVKGPLNGVNATTCSLVEASASLLPNPSIVSFTRLSWGFII